MSLTARDLPGTVLDETVVQQPEKHPVPGGPERGRAMDPDHHLLMTDSHISGSPAPPTPAGSRYLFTSGARPLDGYTIKRAIGRGGFGEVYYARSDAGKDVALKLITRNVDVERRGVQHCMNLKCPHLVTIYDLKSNDQGDTFVIMELISGPSLAGLMTKYPKGMPQAELKHWLRGLVDGVAYLHDHGIVHRDLKPANLFLEDGIIKIGDYGLSKMMTASQGSIHSESIGTCHYMAPEISTGRYGKEVDVYAIGVIVHEMLTGRVPFNGETVGEVLMKHLTARPDLSALPEPYKAIVGRAMAKEPKQRPGVYELLPPEDRPSPRAIRFVGERPVGPPEPEPAPQPAPPDRTTADDVVRIGEEEPVFYIGPDTQPPRRPVVTPRFWARRPKPQLPVRTVAAPAPPPRKKVVQAPPAPVAPPPPPAAPTLPSARVRVAELSGSMLWAAVLSALLTIPGAAILGVDVPEHPQQLAFLTVMTTLGAWSIQVLEKLIEGRRLDSTIRRAMLLGLGVLVGIVGIILAQWTHLKLQPAVEVPSLVDAHYVTIGLAERPNWLGFATYFGLTFALMPWTWLASRNRSSRFRVLLLAWTAGIGLLTALVCPFPQPWGLGVLMLIAAVVQLTSPWSEDAAAYARYMRKFKPGQAA